MLDPAVVHLNHGSFGACLRTVFAAADGWRRRLEAAPMRFFVLEWQDELDRARVALADFLRAPAARLAFVPSATAGVAIALSSATLATGDEVLITDHTYRACRNQVERLATSRGLTIATVPLPLPFDDDACVDAISRAITPRTRLALLDHLTSPTALRLPLERLLPVLAARGLAVIVDGAHAPGQLALDVGALLALGATWYTGNHHKWLCAPKASGFLVAAEGAAAIPLVTSHGASPDDRTANRLHAELDWAGTHDPAAHLTVPFAIEAVGAEGGGWPAIHARNHALALALREHVTESLGGGPPLAPATAVGAMATIPITLPAGVEALALEKQLLARGWEVPIVAHPRGPFVRISAHLYNHAAEGDALAAELRGSGIRTRRIA
ncbi:MAG: aminotransferase class V-fold PLP-dependent enzyme [Myxococcota bacterium]|nr:aminotransferase class V-fold PLP-dependent enzyme [Myxococcota bacterium]